ncbi:secreted, membrane-associated protein [Cryptosporidium felis]|nr:secreted, membrane-associated protein [Cryptosporidium felis]
MYSGNSIPGYIFLGILFLTIINDYIGLFIECTSEVNKEDYGAEGSSLSHTPESWRESSSKCDPESILGFMKVNVITLVFAEFECNCFHSSKLILSRYWQDRFRVSDYRFLIKRLVRYWKYLYKPNHEIHRDPLIKFYSEHEDEVKSRLLDIYMPTDNLELQLKNFYRQIYAFDCENLKVTYAMLLLIFIGNLEYAFSATLFYLLVCSVVEFNNLAFEERFKKIVDNTDSVTSRLVVIGGDSIQTFISALQRYNKEIPKIDIEKTNLSQRTSYPLNVGSINVSTFGLSSSVEVLIGFDMLKAARHYSSSLFEAITRLIYDENLFLSLKEKIQKVHDLNMENFRKFFNDCIKVRETYPELAGVIIETDYQKRAKRKKSTKKRHK